MGYLVHSHILLINIIHMDVYTKVPRIQAYYITNYNKFGYHTARFLLNSLGSHPGATNSNVYGLVPTQLLGYSSRIHRVKRTQRLHKGMDPSMR